MKRFKQYIRETLGAEINPVPIARQQLGGLPLHIIETYKFYVVVLFINRELLIVVPKHEEGFSILQTEKNFALLKSAFGKIVVLLLPKITSFNRKRLIEKGINFIVPGTQLYLPDLLINLKETFFNPNAKRKTETLLPSAQYLLIYHLIHRNDAWKLEEHSFKEIAKQMGYTAMAITKAVNNLKYHDLIEVAGDKEKHIRFLMSKGELWQEAEKRHLLINPVLKSVYVDEMPTEVNLLYSNTSALPEYSNMNPGRQKYYAIEKSIFYSLQKTNALVNANTYEGMYCLEVWKYNPQILAKNTSVVDPLSLYLSLKASHDERIEMALTNIIDDQIW